jgi:hypothetical protein
VKKGMEQPLNGKFSRNNITFGLNRDIYPNPDKLDIQSDGKKNG